MPVGSVVMPCRHGYRHGIPSITSHHQSLVPMSPSHPLGDTEPLDPFTVCFPLPGWTDAMRGARGHRVPPQHMAGGKVLPAPFGTRRHTSALL